MDAIRSNLIWNIASLGVLGITGLALNFIIAIHYNSGALGVFNQVLAVYLITSQIAVGGFAFSVLAAMPLSVGDRRAQADSLSAALLLTAALAIPTATLLWLIAEPIGNLFSSPPVGAGIRWAAPGVAFFALNKVMLLSLNGAGHLRAYAAGQACRFLLILIVMVTLVVAVAPSDTLPFAFTGAEAILLVVLVIYWRRVIGFSFGRALGQWLSHHTKFGYRAYFNGLMLDANTKIDVIVLGYYSTDSVVGIYALAANVAEGLAQIPIVVQTVLNPILARLVADRDQVALSALVRRTVRLSIPAMAIVTLLAVAVFVPASMFLFVDQSYTEAWPVLAVLGSGIALSAGYVPFALVFNQAGRPTLNLTMIGALVATNLALNVILIPSYGALGAAVATALAMILVVPFVKIMARRGLDLSL